MALSSLPTIYDLTPDYASNLAAEMFWPGDQGRWQAANLAAPDPTDTVRYVKTALWLLAGFAAYKAVRGGGGLSGDLPLTGRVVRRHLRCVKWRKVQGKKRCAKFVMVRTHLR